MPQGFFEGYAEGMKPEVSLALKAMELKRNEDALTLQTKLATQKHGLEVAKFASELEKEQTTRTLKALTAGKERAVSTGDQAAFDAFTMKENQLLGLGNTGMRPETQQDYVPPGTASFAMPMSPFDEKAQLEQLKAQYREVPIEKEAYRAWKVANPGGDPLTFLKTLKQATNIHMPDQGHITVHPTNRGLVSVNNITGEQKLLKDEAGQPLLPVAADVGLAGAKRTATEEAERISGLKKSFPKVKNALIALESQWANVDRTIDKALDQVGPFTTGLGAWTAAIPATTAKDLKENLETIKANIGFDKLQEMRQNSPTGGALGQVSDLENRLLQAVRGSLAQNQSTKQLTDNLKVIKTLLGELKMRQKVALDLDFREAQQPQGGGQTQPQANKDPLGLR